ncbi:hypothetical protein NQZ68_025269 [Dissostichus eleginoides]|nr:hypothetical protein NQZ68_025269 [Dissostichus eleginoides]
MPTLPLTWRMRRVPPTSVHIPSPSDAASPVDNIFYEFCKRAAFILVKQWLKRFKETCVMMSPEARWQKKATRLFLKSLLH